MGKCVDQVYFVEKSYKRQVLKIFNKLTMFLCNLWSVSENYARLRAHFFVLFPIAIDMHIYIYIYIYICIYYIYIYIYINICYIYIYMIVKKNFF